MGLMEVIRKMAGKKGETKEKFKQMQEDDHLRTLLEERKKSSNQRELERIMKQREEEEYKKVLDSIRKKETKAMWKDKSILKSGTSILKTDKPILKDDKPIIHQKNIFLDNKTKSPLTQEAMFFKW